MILILLGTQDKSFKRLLNEVERLITNNVINDKVIAQIGHTKFDSKKMKCLNYIDNKKLQEYYEESDLIITHGGVGSIMDGLKHNKKVIAVPRLKNYKEHTNDHQLQIINNFNDAGYIIGINNVNELENAINKVKDFVPKKYKSNKEHFIKELINIIK